MFVDRSALGYICYEDEICLPSAHVGLYSGSIINIKDYFAANGDLILPVGKSFIDVIFYTDNCNYLNFEESFYEFLLNKKYTNKKDVTFYLKALFDEYEIPINKTNYNNFISKLSELREEEKKENITKLNTDFKAVCKGVKFKETVYLFQGLYNIEVAENNIPKLMYDQLHFFDNISFGLNTDDKFHLKTMLAILYSSKNLDEVKSKISEIGFFTLPKWYKLHELTKISEEVVKEKDEFYKDKTFLLFYKKAKQIFIDLKLIKGDQ